MKIAVVVGMALGAGGLALASRAQHGQGTVKTISAYDVQEKLDGKDARVTTVDAATVAWANAHEVHLELDCQRPLGSTALRYVECMGGRADDATLGNITALTGLRSLELSRSDVTDAGLGIVRRLRRAGDLGGLTARVTGHVSYGGTTTAVAG